MQWQSANPPLKLSRWFVLTGLSLSATTITVDGLRPGYAAGGGLAGLEVTTVWPFTNGPYLFDSFTFLQPVV